MRYHISVKFIAVVLAALSLFAVVGGSVGVAALVALDLYENPVEKLYDEEVADIRRQFAVNLVHRYASLELGNVPEAYLDAYHDTGWLLQTFLPGEFFYVIRDEGGNAVESTVPGDLTGLTRHEIPVTQIRYRRLLQGTSREPSSEATEPPELHQDRYYDSGRDTFVDVVYQYESLPPYSVDLYLTGQALREDPLWTVLKILWSVRYQLFWIIAAGLLIFAIAAVYLCCAAGRKPHSDRVMPVSISRLPLDLFALGLILAGLLLIQAGDIAIVGLVRRAPGILLPCITLAGSLGCLLAVAFGYACVAQIKAPDHYWWRHSAIGFVSIRIERIFRRLLRWARTMLAMLPVIWQWLATAAAMVLAVLVTGALTFATDSPAQPLFALAFLFCLAGCVGVVCYGGYCFGVLIRGARHMARGNLSHQISTRYLWGAFRDFATQLNSLADAAQLAAQQKMRSERMKTELITNVSHDIKTPLTSIINYVDLLKQPHSDEEHVQYLEVVDRQSQRLKKLVDDLMEMSKASTGNMAVDAARMDAGETITQALGEFNDKFTRAGLSPVFHAPQEPVYMLADGRLVWRVLSNILGNAVKYAMPNTRLYIDLTRQQEHVVISVKNISREQLNVQADELLERFVRGDVSRNTEGSGLGLNIAQSLMELQKGQLHLLVDGDLFKVTLIFPGA